MWFASVYSKSLRDFRVAILGWGVGTGLLMYAILAAYPSLVVTSAARASLVSLSGSFAWFAEPIAVGTPGGYATFKCGLTILVIAIWPLLVGSRILRGEEERGAMDALLAVPRGRGRVAFEKLAALWTALLAMGLLIALLTFAGGASVHANFGLGESLLFGLNVALIGGVFGSLALLLSQFTQERRRAAGITGGILLLAIVLDMVHRVLPNTEWISRLSPVYYYNLSRPLVPSYGTNFGALLILLVLSLALGGASVACFARRDIGGTVALPRLLRLPDTAPTANVLPANAWSLRSVYTRSLASILVPTSWWTLAIAGLAGWMVVVVQQSASKLATIAATSPALKGFLAVGGGNDATLNATFLSALFVLVPLLLMAFAVTQANSWSADEEEGLQEIVLSTPQSRLTVLLARFGAVTTATVLIGVVTLAATALAAAASGLALDGGNLAAATLSIIPLGLLMAALGYLLAGWLRTAVDTGLLSFLLVIWFFITFIGPGLNWSDATLHLSAFYYYGTPLLHGLSVAHTFGILAAALLTLALASLRFMRKDIAH